MNKTYNMGITAKYKKKKSKSQGNRYKGGSRTALTLRKELLKKLRFKNIHNALGKRVTALKTKELLEVYFDSYNIPQDERQSTKEKLGFKVDDRFQDHETYVYFIGNKDFNFVKIGYSNNPSRRIRDIQVGCPFEVDILGVVEGDKGMEADLQDNFSLWKHRGEWFRYEGALKDYIEKLPHIL